MSVDEGFLVSRHHQTKPHVDKSIEKKNRIPNWIILSQLFVCTNCDFFFLSHLPHARRSKKSIKFFALEFNFRSFYFFSTQPKPTLRKQQMWGKRNRRVHALFSFFFLVCISFILLSVLNLNSPTTFWLRKFLFIILPFPFPFWLQCAWRSCPMCDAQVCHHFVIFIFFI